MGTAAMEATLIHLISELKYVEMESLLQARNVMIMELAIMMAEVQHA